MKFLYRLFFWGLPIILQGFGLIFPRVNRFLAARKNLFLRLKEFRSRYSGKLAWFHVASLGEYEQAKPVIEALKKQNSEIGILVSFFSPSGYEPALKKPHPLVDFVTYLPLDRRSWAQEFVRLVNPSLAFFVKYDLWYHHLEALRKFGVPHYLISASFRPNQPYFRWYGGFFKSMFESFNWIFTQNQPSLDLLNTIAVTNASRSGDTRFDRVWATAKHAKSFPEITHWINGRPTVVVGSAWQEDMDLILPLIEAHLDYVWIIAPHDLSPEPMDRWAKQLSVKSVTYSKWTPESRASILFIDNIGMLSSLYQFAKIAYVGGGFGKGLHNILEPLGFGIPVIFGKVKNVSKFPESIQSQHQGCGFEVNSPEDLLNVFDRLEQEENYQKATFAAQEWVSANVGAADRVMQKVQELTPLS